MKYFKKVQRGKIYLSPVNTEDYEVMIQWVNDPRATKGITMHSKIISLEKGKNRLESVAKEGDYTLAIVKQENDELIGTIGLYNLDQLNQIAELSILIWNAEEHGKWYGTDAINAMLSFAFHTLNLYTVYLRVYSFNTNAIRCYEKVWFKKTGECHHSCYRDGEWFDKYFMEIQKPDREEKNK